MSADGRIDPTKLESWITKARIDPNDPENEELMIRWFCIFTVSKKWSLDKMISWPLHTHCDVIFRVREARRKAEVASGSTSGASQIAGGGSYFRLDQHLDQLVFGTEDDLVRSVDPSIETVENFYFKYKGHSIIKSLSMYCFYYYIWKNMHKEIQTTAVLNGIISSLLTKFIKHFIHRQLCFQSLRMSGFKWSNFARTRSRSSRTTEWSQSLRRRFQGEF